MSVSLGSYEGVRQMDSMQINSERIVSRVSVDSVLINKILRKLNLTPKNQNYRVPEEGRIASNIIVDTFEQEQVMLRFYPSGCQGSKLESGFVSFEITALDFLSKKGVQTPAPLYFDNQYPMVLENDVLVFAYKLLPGTCFGQRGLSVNLAKESAKLLSSMLAVSETYLPTAEEKLPEGDITYIKKIFQTLLNTYPELRTNTSLQKMFDHASKTGLVEKLEQTPKGIVHADFFAENILYDEKLNSYSIIDFGDAYFGHTLMDIVIGSMEFCVKEDDSWDMEMFKAFIHELAPWLNKNKIEFDFFHDLLLVNCLRFAIYTLPGDLESKTPISENGYIRRFEQLKREELTKQLRTSYESAMFN